MWQQQRSWCWLLPLLPILIDCQFYTGLGSTTVSFNEWSWCRWSLRWHLFQYNQGGYRRSRYQKYYSNFRQNPLYVIWSQIPMIQASSKPCQENQWSTVQVPDKHNDKTTSSSVSHITVCWQVRDQTLRIQTRSGTDDEKRGENIVGDDAEDWSWYQWINLMAMNSCWSQNSFHNQSHLCPVRQFPRAFFLFFYFSSVSGRVE